MKVVSMKGSVGGWVGEEGRGKGLGQTFGDQILNFVLALYVTCIYTLHKNQSRFVKYNAKQADDSKYLNSFVSYSLCHTAGVRAPTYIRIKMACKPLPIKV